MTKYAVILAGGSGTRLWPLSRKNFPKQFLPLYDDLSLLQHTFLRMSRLTSPENIFFVTNRDHLYNVLNQVRELAPTFPEDHVIIEPEGRNTFPAIVLALAYLKEVAGAEGSDAVIFTPADAYVADEERYVSTLETATEHAARGLVLVGTTPVTPEVGFGYIKIGEATDEIFHVHSFHEKPTEERAIEFLESGDYLWNAGIYVGTLDSFLAEIAEQAPEVFDLFQTGLASLVENFALLPSLSIDYALAEKSEHVFVVQGSFGWNDVGSFDALAKVLEERGMPYKNHVGVDSAGVFVHSASGRLVVTIGVKDLVIVDHNDSLLIHERGRSAEVGPLLKSLKEAGRKEVEHNLLVHRPWGRYEVLVDTPTYKVKKITVYPGAKLSLQSHQHRAEHWIVVAGVAEATIGDRVIRLEKNESAFISSEQMHRLANPGTENLEIVEVQTGAYLGEDDIKRYEDTYKRT